MIYNEDCLTWMQRQPAASVATIISSPPYNRGIAYNHYQDRRRDYLDWQRAIWTQACRILQPDGHLFINIAGSADKPFLPYQVAALVPWRVQNHIIWAKAVEFHGHIYGRSTVNIRAQYRLPNGHETVWHFTRQGRTPVDIGATAVGYRPEFAEDNFQRTGRRTRPTTTCWHIPYETTGAWGQSSASLKGQNTHPAIFPRELVRRLIRLAGGRGPVYDPFGGTGTTAVVAQEMGVEWMTTEIDPDYCAFMQERTGAR